MESSSCSKCLTNIKVTILTALVLSSFYMSSFGWRQIETSESTKISIAGIILVVMYTLMIFELIHRTIAALIGAVLAIAAYDCLIELASMEEIIDWEDLETLSLLFGMMIIVNVLANSGLFDYLAIWSYRKSNGRFWTLITTMAIITALLSALIDNVSTMLLMSPTLIKLSELEHIDPRYLLMIMVIFCNIGGCATPVGDPPNLIIIGDPLIDRLNITFGSFTAFCAPCVLITIFCILLYLRLFYKSKESFRIVEHINDNNEEKQEEVINDYEQQQVANRRNDISNLSSSITYSGNSDKFQLLSELEVLNNFAVQLEKFGSKLTSESLILIENIREQTNQLENAIDKLTIKENSLGTEFVVSVEHRRGSRLDEFQINELMKYYSIKNRTILYQSISVLTVTILLFFIQSLPGTNLTLGWISLFAGLSLLVMSSAVKLSNDDDEEEQVEEDPLDLIMNRIEWSTLVFFFALFIVMEVMAKLGLIRFIGNQITSLIDLIPPGNLRSIVAITIVLWASGIASAFIDNVPFTSMMIKVLGTMIIQSRSEFGTSGTQPLVFALAFGACFGGNGTLIGASANLVTAGVSSRYGYPITFNGFFKFGSPITVISLIIANIYLVVAFLILEN